MGLMGHKIYKIHIRNFENMGFRILLYVNIAGCTRVQCILPEESALTIYKLM